MIKSTLSKLSFLTIAGSILILGGAKSHAQDNSDWDVSVGAGTVYSPTYEGSDEYVLSPIPFIDIKWKDRVSLGYQGLTADVLKNDSTTLGLGLVYDGGRDEDGSTLFNDNNDNTLRGMGDIDGAAGIKAYASHDFTPVTFSGSVVQYLGDDNDGFLAKVGLSKRIPINRQLFITPSINTTWADENYMSTFFGVNGTQAAASQFTQYNAESGFKDVSTGINALYLINDNWFVFSNATVKQLLGDAADSPISDNDTSASVMATIGYKF